MIQLKNEETGTIIFKASYEITTGIGIAHFPMTYTTTIRAKDNDLSFVFEVGKVPTTQGRVIYAYPPKDNMKEIEEHFLSVKNGIMKYVNEQQ